MSSRASSLESPAVAGTEESLTNGVEDSAGGSGLASLAVSGDEPCGDKIVEETTGEEGEEAATAVCYTVTVTTSSVAPVPVDTQVNWSRDGADKYCQSLGMGEGSGEVSL